MKQIPAYLSIVFFIILSTNQTAFPEMFSDTFTVGISRIDDYDGNLIRYQIGLVFNPAPENYDDIASITIYAPDESIVKIFSSDDLYTEAWEQLVLKAEATLTSPPQAGNYSFTAIFNDESSEAGSAEITADDIPGSSPVITVPAKSNDILSDSTPTFQWEPFNCDGFGCYSIFVMTDYWGTGDYPGSTTSITFNEDGSASVDELPDGNYKLSVVAYKWNNNIQSSYARIADYEIYTGPPFGTLGGRCYDNGTCDEGLVCVQLPSSNICSNCPLESILERDQAELEMLRTFRDRNLTQTEFGRTFIDKYYEFAPIMNIMIEDNPLLKEMMRQTIKTMIPVVEIMY